MLSDILGLVAVLILVVLNGFFVAAEFSLISVRKTRIDQLVSEGSKRARQVQRTLTHLDTYIAATQLGITMASLALGFVGEPALAHLVEPLFGLFLPQEGAAITSHLVALIIAFSIVTALHIVIGELAPKSIALQRAEATALWVSAPLNLFLTVFRPFILALNGIGNGVVRLIGLEPATEHAGVHSVEELELLVRSTRQAGLLEEQQERMVAGVFDFGEREANRVMTPRTRIEAIPATIAFPELVHRLAVGRHTRLPVYEETIDHVIGMVHAKDVLRLLDPLLDPTEPHPATFAIGDVLRPMTFAPQNLPLDELLALMRRERTQSAILVDEFGGTEGMVTLEDLVEEIVGEIADEFDEATVSRIERLPDGTVRLDGLLPLDDVNERFGLGITVFSHDTVGGYVMGELGRTANAGDAVVTPKGQQLRVAEMDGLRVARVLLIAPSRSVIVPSEAQGNTA